MKFLPELDSKSDRSLGLCVLIWYSHPSLFVFSHSMIIKYFFAGEFVLRFKWDLFNSYLTPSEVVFNW